MFLHPPTECIFSNTGAEGHQEVQDQVPSKLVCATCDKVFKSIRGLQIHQGKVHSDASTSPRCKICEKTFSTLKNMKSHFKIIHLNEKSFPCDLCQKSFVTNAYLKRHKVALHTKTEDKVIRCPDCGKGYPTSSKLKIHAGNVHSTVKCITCGKQFRQKSELQKHVRDVHLKIEVRYSGGWNTHRYLIEVDCF